MSRSSSDRPASRSMMLSGLRSRCTTPWACAWASASSTWRQIAIPRSAGIRAASMRSPSDRPGTYSITR